MNFSNRVSVSFGIWQIAAKTYMIEPGPEFIGIIYASGTLLAIPLIAYGILRTHLFDIDLRVRWTIKQSTLAAIMSNGRTIKLLKFKVLQQWNLMMPPS